MPLKQTKQTSEQRKVHTPLNKKTPKNKNKNKTR